MTLIKGIALLKHLKTVLIWKIEKKICPPHGTAALQDSFERLRTLLGIRIDHKLLYSLNSDAQLLLYSDFIKTYYFQLPSLRFIHTLTCDLPPAWLTEIINKKYLSLKCVLEERIPFLYFCSQVYFPFYFFHSWSPIYILN